MSIESQDDLIGLMKIGRIVGLTLRHMLEALQPGMSTAELDAIGAEFLKAQGARSAPILAYNYPGHTCISINDEAAHGIPGSRIIQPGDLVNVDVSAELDGYWADNGASIAVEPVSPEKQRLCDWTKRALEAALGAARAGQPIHAVGKAIEGVARSGGYSTVRELPGHGVGRHIHEKPSIPNYFERRANQRLTEGLVITLEPFLSTGKGRIKTDPDGWTLRTTDGGLVAQYEHTIIVTKDDPILVTAV